MVINVMILNLKQFFNESFGIDTKNHSLIHNEIVIIFVLNSLIHTVFDNQLLKINFIYDSRLPISDYKFCHFKCVFKALLLRWHDFNGMVN